ncbi:alpha-L-rhamnosidase N-terminal domain-containing protein [Candidatus Pristimantibacillus sp. PTI5]|uniref:alpha-L-rhamnosidase N-terminal domain-containing protein n=1 Tax=Candidatus Pristimantibacillus sp. PTI5 TaxID=3400422 RepID=UPI003B014138
MIRTDHDGWKVRESATKLANVYGLENFDARIYPNGWHDNGFDDSEWGETCARKPSFRKRLDTR